MPSTTSAGPLGFRRLVQRARRTPRPSSGLAFAGLCWCFQKLDAPGDVVGHRCSGSPRVGPLGAGWVRDAVSPWGQLSSSGVPPFVLRVQILPQGLGARRGCRGGRPGLAPLVSLEAESHTLLPEPGLVSVAGGWSGVSLGSKRTRTLSYLLGWSKRQCRNRTCVPTRAGGPAGAAPSPPPGTRCFPRLLAPHPLSVAPPWTPRCPVWTPASAARGSWTTWSGDPRSPAGPASGGEAHNQLLKGSEVQFPLMWNQITGYFCAT